MALTQSKFQRTNTEYRTHSWIRDIFRQRHMIWMGQYFCRFCSNIQFQQQQKRKKKYAAKPMPPLQNIINSHAIIKCSPYWWKRLWHRREYCNPTRTWIKHYFCKCFYFVCRIKPTQNTHTHTQYAFTFQINKLNQFLFGNENFDSDIEN